MFFQTRFNNNNNIQYFLHSQFLLHSKVEDLHEHIPVRVLPVEWGGDEESFDILARKWRHRVDELREFLRGLGELSAESTKLNACNDDIFGTVGAFRKLDID